MHFRKPTCIEPYLRHGARLRLEPLEDRSLPSIFFSPTGGAPDGMIQGPGTMSNVNLELIYWGDPSSWRNSGVTPDAITAAVNSIYDGPYFRGLAQYGIGIGNQIVVHTVSDSSPPPGYTTTDVDHELLFLFNQGALTEPEADGNRLYFVITAPGTTSAPVPVGNGQHDFDVFGDGFELFEDGNDTFRYAWVAATSSLDQTTQAISRELVNAVTDIGIGGPGVRFNPSGNPAGEFELAADPFAANDAYRLNGVLVQAYWSHNDSAWTVPTDDSFDFTVADTAQLLVPGFSGPTGEVEPITLDRTPQGGVQVNLTLDFPGGGIALPTTVQFEPGAISGVLVNAGSDDTQVDVESAVVPVTIQLGTGHNTVTISQNAGLLDNIQAEVIVNGPARGDPSQPDPALNDTLHINDQNNSRADVYTLFGSLLLRSAAGTGASLGGAITYNRIGNVTIQGGSGTYNVQDTDNSIPGNVTSTLITGNNATVNVTQASGTLNLILGAGLDTLLLGSNHNVAGFLAPVFIAAPNGSTDLTVDDSQDTLPRTATLDASSITDLAPARINYSSNELRSLTVKSGTGGTTFSIHNTPAVTTTIASGLAVDNFFVFATTGELDINGQSGAVQHVDIDNASASGLQGFQGVVDVSPNQGITTLQIDDFGDTTVRTVNIDAGQVTGLTPAAIKFGRELDGLTINGGSAPLLLQNVFNVTPLIGGPVTINGSAAGGPLSGANNVLNLRLAGVQNPHLMTTSLTSGQWTFGNADPVSFNSVYALEHDGVNSVVDGVFLIYADHRLAEYSRSGLQQIDVNAVAVSTGVDAVGDQAAFIFYDTGALYEWSPTLGFKLVDYNVAQASASQQAANTVFIRYRDGKVYEHTGTSAIAGFTGIDVNAVQISAGVDAQLNPAVFIVYNNSALFEWSAALGFHGIDANVASVSAESRADAIGFTAGFQDTVFIVYRTGQLYEHNDAGFQTIATNVTSVSAGQTNVGTPDNPSVRPAAFFLNENSAVTEWNVGRFHWYRTIDANAARLLTSEQTDAVFILYRDGQLFEWLDGAFNRIAAGVSVI
jgi:hypothetical protein